MVESLVKMRKKNKRAEISKDYTVSMLLTSRGSPKDDDNFKFPV